MLGPDPLVQEARSEPNTIGFHAIYSFAIREVFRDDLVWLY
jgi:hypothetical protein